MKKGEQEFTATLLLKKDLWKAVPGWKKRTFLVAPFTRYTLCWCQHPPSALVYSLARTKCGYLILHMHLDEDGPLFNA